MNDVTDMLGSGPSGAAPSTKPNKKKVKKPTGMKRELYNLLGDDHLPPMVNSLTGSIIDKNNAYNRSLQSKEL